MNELISFINKSDAGKYDLLKTAIAHHRFSWVHPFGNGNGRVVRLLTYAMMIKYGFNVKEGKLINPTAVFCNDRNYYYQKLKEADEGDDESLLSWCDYVLNGILDEVSKVNKLLNFDYLYKRILVPTIKYAAEREYLNEVEVNILMIGIKKQEFRSTDLNEVLSALSARQITHQIAKMKDSGFIQPLKENGRTYFINFMNNFLMRALVKILEREGFIPAIDK
jgi:Fic family protein